jgi:hypothetical protein
MMDFPGDHIRGRCDALLDAPAEAILIFQFFFPESWKYYLDVIE